MKQFWLSIPLLVALSWTFGCSPKPPAERIVGSWSLDVSCTLAADKELTNVSREIRSRFEQFVRPYIRNLIFEFEADGIYRVRNRANGDRYQSYDRYFYRIVKTTKDGRLEIESSVNADFNPSSKVNAAFKESQMHTQIGNRMYSLKPY